MVFWLCFAIFFIGSLISLFLSQHGNVIFLAGYLNGLLVYWALDKEAAKRQGGAE